MITRRVLTEDRPENRGFFSESVEVVVEVMVNRQGQINHFDDLGDDLRASSEPCEKVTNVAVVLFDRDGQVFACEELLLRDEAMIAVPIIGEERFAFEADFVEELLACGVITATKNPGDGSPSNRVIGSPKPQFLSLFFTKRHISSRVTTTTSALVDGSGSLRASSRTQFRTAHVADAENARDGAKADVAHSAEKQGQRLHRRRLATRRRHGEIATAREAKIALKATHNSILYMIRSAAALATNLAHGRRLSRSLPRVCYQNG